MNSSNPPSQPLISMVLWSQRLACEVLAPGDLAVDLTAGKGRDTLALARAVGPTGQVVAFDLQTVALEATGQLLQTQHLNAVTWPVGQKLSGPPGVFLVHACHSRLAESLPRPAKVIMANLGYLPGGDPALTTRAESTLAALETALVSLASGGRLVVTVYPGHPGGDEEARLVETLFAELPGNKWRVLSLRPVNQGNSPYLLVAERVS